MDIGHRCFHLLTFAALLLIPALASSQSAMRWVALGPYGGPADVLATDRDSAGQLFAAGANGLVQSADGGAHWLSPEKNLPAVQFVRVEPDDSSVVYAGGAKGVFRSDDAGTTWKRMGQLTDVYDLAAAGSGEELLYAAAFDGLYTSHDGGKHWRRNAALRGQSAYFVVVDPVNPDVVFAGATPRIQAAAPAYIAMTRVTLYRSEDAGKSWKSLTQGLNDPSGMPVSVLSLSVDPANPAILYAGSGKYSELIKDPLNGYSMRRTPARGVFKSIDGGQKWQETGLHPLMSADDATVHSVRVDPADSKVVYALSGISWGWDVETQGVFKSVDGGGHWQPSNQGLANPEGKLPSVYSLRFTGTSGSTLWLGSDRGLFTSNDQGAHWQTVTADLSGVSIHGLTANSGSNGKIMIAVDRGLLSSANSGASWQTIDVSDLLPAQPDRGPVIRRTTSSLVALEGQSPVAYAVLQSGFNEQYGFLRSGDGDSNWRAALLQLPEEEDEGSVIAGIRSFTVHPEKPARIFADVDIRSGIETDPSGVYRSDDGGDHWVMANRGLPGQGQVQALVIDPVDPDTIYAGAVEPIRNYAGAVQSCYRSTDGGVTWHKRGGIVPGNRMINFLVNDPARPHALFAGTTQGLYYSANGGKTWQSLNAGLKAREQIKSYVTNGSGDSMRTVVRSWKALPKVYSLVEDPDDSRYLLVSTSLGVYRTTRNGSRWQTANDGIGAAVDGVRLVSGPAQSRQVYAYAPNGGGVFKLDGR
ncbi:MAG: hypothetical protein FIA97_13700 [Methylococcaceae bacterium]|nr:hypothetical protein [Methylococcaceae bacterium]